MLTNFLVASMFLVVESRSAWSGPPIMEHGGHVVSGRIVDPDGKPVAGVKIEVLPALLERARTKGLFAALRADGSMMPPDSRLSCKADAEGSFQLIAPDVVGSTWLLVEVPGRGTTLAPVDLGGIHTFGTLRMEHRECVFVELVDAESHAPIVGARVVATLHDDPHIANWLAPGGEPQGYWFSEASGGLLWLCPPWAVHSRCVSGLEGGRFWSESTTDASGHASACAPRYGSDFLQVQGAAGVVYVGPRHPNKKTEFERYDCNRGTSVKMRLSEGAEGSRTAMEARIAVVAPLIATGGEQTFDPDAPRRRDLLDTGDPQFGPTFRLWSNEAITVPKIPGSVVLVAARPLGASDWSVARLEASEVVEDHTVTVPKRHAVVVRLRSKVGSPIDGAVRAVRLLGADSPDRQSEMLIPFWLGTPSIGSKLGRAEDGVRIADLLPGPHAIVAEADGFEPALEDAPVDTGDDTSIEITMKRLAHTKLALLVRDATGEHPAASARVAWRASPQSEERGLPTTGEAVADERGEIELDLPPDVHLSMRDVSSELGACAELDLRGESATVRLEPRIRISGVVADCQHPPDEPFVVEVEPKDGSELTNREAEAHAQVDARGRFDLVTDPAQIVTLRIRPFCPRFEGFRENRCCNTSKISESAWRWYVRPQGGAEVPFRIEMSDPPESPVDKRVRVYGHVTVADDRSLEAWLDGRGDDHKVLVRSSGEFDFGEVEADKYRLMIRELGTDGYYKTLAQKYVVVERGKGKLKVEMDL